MPRAVAFLLDPQDVPSFIAKRHGAPSIVVYAYGRKTKKLLDEHGIRYKPFNHFLPMNTIIDYYTRVNQLVVMMDQRIFASGRIYFLELLRSVALLEKYLKPHPFLVYVADILNEPIYVKYHSQSFNLFNQVMLEYCKFHKIQVVVLRRKWTDHASIMGNVFSLIISSMKNAFGSKFKIRQAGAKKTMVISASSYHLSNLKQFITLARSKWNIIVLGKIPRSLSDISSKTDTLIDTSNLPFSFKYMMSLIRQLTQAAVYASQCNELARKLIFAFGLDRAYSQMVGNQIRYWKFVLIPESALLESFFSHILKLCTPNVIVSSNSIDNFTRTLHIASTKIGIKGAVVLHYPLLCETDAIEEQNGIQSVLFANGNQTKRLLGRYPTNFSLCVTGLPSYDKYHGILASTKVTQPHKLVSILFLLSQNPLYFQNLQEEVLIEALTVLNDVTTHRIGVTVRTHPDQPVGFINQHDYDFPITVRNDTPLENELQSHQIVITQTTSAAVDAIILKKPLIYLNTQSVKDYSPFATSGSAIGVYRIESLIPAILSLIKHPRQLSQAQRLFVEQYCYKLDGGAAKRILQSLNRLVVS